MTHSVARFYCNPTGYLYKTMAETTVIYHGTVATISAGNKIDGRDISWCTKEGGMRVVNSVQD